ncbi:heme o synthase [Sciscionella sediminilitoris]|uniref:heme o synthase n=1 Tax=Sciscionella sediminilitoris TaxID=1445613 RepID=UPI0004DEDDA5|nr:heme o synthase [Sciscionella sp. SE31]
MRAVTAIVETRPGGQRSPKDVFLKYLALTKPRIIEQLLVATIPSMLLAQRGVPALWLVVATVAFGALAAGSAGAFNCVVDADIDAVMKRTAKRPIVNDTVSKRSALIFAIVLGALAVGGMWLTTNLLSAVLTLAAIAFYVLVYTMWLKRRTSQNVVWGGICGCMPVLIGWSAVTGTVGWQAFVMFGVIFFWTPPHSWALGMKYREDYTNAGVPMLPSVASPRQVTLRIVLYSWAMALCALVLIPGTSWLYAACAVIAGAWFLAAVHRLHSQVRRGAEYKPMGVFHLSNTYLCLVFVMLAVDAVVGWPVLGWPF